MSLEMESKRCMNTSCPTSKSTQWRKGWTLRSGASALLCNTCGLAYGELKFCDVFHQEQDGWRPCCLCGKRLHCGCIASQPFIVLRDSGGIFCITCSKNSGQIPERTCNENLIGYSPPSDACVVGPSSKRSVWLPHCWSRLSQEEIQRQTSGVPNSTIVPLFEKKLSPTDVGRRVIIPKKFAEAYFPPISQAEGINLPIHDEEGTKWVSKFRYYTSNNIRMYILEGVTPWIKSMQLQVGDTITFSRMDPEREYIIGIRKALVSLAQSKRLHIDNQDASKLEITLKEAQHLLCPSMKPNIVMIDDYEFEEYDQPPIIGKKSELIKRKNEQEVVSDRKRN